MKVIAKVQTNNDQYGSDMWSSEHCIFEGFEELTGTGNKWLEEIIKERIRQMGYEETNKLDETNSKNDFIAYINAYLGRAADKCPRNDRENQVFTDNMIKVAALALAALEKHGVTNE